MNAVMDEFVKVGLRSYVILTIVTLGGRYLILARADRGGWGHGSRFFVLNPEGKEIERFLSEAGAVRFACEYLESAE